MLLSLNYAARHERGEKGVGAIEEFLSTNFSTQDANIMVIYTNTCNKCIIEES